jgi:hypothetical protein
MMELYFRQSDELKDEAEPRRSAAAQSAVLDFAGLPK